MADKSLISNEGAIDMSIPTNSDLSSLQYFAVKLDSNEEVVAATANDAAIGILQNAPDGSSNEKIAEVRVQGLSKCKVSEAVEQGDRLTPTSGSKGEIADAADEEYFASALSSADADDLATVLLNFGKAHSSDA